MTFVDPAVLPIREAFEVAQRVWVEPFVAAAKTHASADVAVPHNGPESQASSVRRYPLDSVP